MQNMCEKKMMNENDERGFSTIFAFIWTFSLFVDHKPLNHLRHESIA